MRRALSGLVVLALVSWGRDARLSKTFYGRISLDIVVARADLIVVARPATPPSVTQEISIAPPGKKTSDKYPAFSRVQSRWTVVDAIKGEAKAGAVLVIDRAEWPRDLELHRRYYVEGVSKSPLYERYERLPGGDEAAPERILFLERSNADVRWVAQGAAELLEHRAAVEALLPRPSPTPGKR